jgi:hypothetical protein
MAVRLGIGDGSSWPTPEKLRPVVDFLAASKGGRVLPRVRNGVKSAISGLSDLGELRISPSRALFASATRAPTSAQTKALKNTSRRVAELSAARRIQSRAVRKRSKENAVRARRMAVVWSTAEDVKLKELGDQIHGCSSLRSPKKTISWYKIVDQFSGKTVDQLRTRYYTTLFGKGNVSFTAEEDARITAFVSSGECHARSFRDLGDEMQRPYYLLRGQARGRLNLL